MSEYENIMGGKLKLKGKALDVKAGGLKKKKKKKQKLFDQISETNVNDLSSGISNEDVKTQEDDEDANKSLSIEGEGTAATTAATSTYEDQHLTSAERRYMEQKEKIDEHRLAKIANKSHRDRIQDFNQYLANMSEHYDIPKVGPG